MREAVIYPGEDGYWIAECPSLPGCISQGSSREEAIVHIREAIHAYILVLEGDGLPKSQPFFAPPPVKKLYMIFFADSDEDVYSLSDGKLLKS